MTLSRPLVQRSKSAIGDGKNLANTVAPEPMKGFQSSMHGDLNIDPFIASVTIF